MGDRAPLPPMAVSPSADMGNDAEKPFTKRLREALALHGVEWGQTAIATFFDIPKQTADRYMGGSEPRPAKLFEMADRLGVDPRWWATGQGMMRSAANEMPISVRDRTPLRRTGRGDNHPMEHKKPHKRLKNLK